MPTITAAASLAIAAFDGVAVAQTPAIPSRTLTWTAPAGCPDSSRVRAQVERALGRALDAPGAPAVAAVAHVGRGPRGAWWVRVVTRIGGEGEGERRVVASSCDQLADATAVIIALAVDRRRPAPDTAAPAVAAAATPAVAAATQPQVTAPAPPMASAPPAPAAVATRLTAGTRVAPAPARVAAARLAVRVAGGVGVALDTNVMPAPAAGLRAHLALLLGPAGRLELAGAYWVPQRATVPMSLAGGDVQLATLALRGCYLPLHSALELGPCAGVESGVLAASGVGANANGSGLAPWAAVVVGGHAAFRPVRVLALVVGLEAALPLFRPTFYLVNVGDVYQPPVLTARASLGIEVRLP